MIWENGLPKKQGLYWFIINPDWSKKPLILSVKNSEYMIYGDYGSSSLDMVCDKKYEMPFKFLEIEKPTKWKKIKNHYDFGQAKRCWIKSKNRIKNDIGIGLLKTSSHGLVGSIVWLENSIYSSSHGVWLRYEYELPKYEFSLLDEPIYNEK